MEQYDLAVLGGGSAGMSAAKRAAKSGADVALVESRTIGGTCVARGCMPKKFLVLAAHKARTMQSDGPRGLNSPDPDVNWAELIDHEQDVVDYLVGANREGVEEYDSIEIIEGKARYLDSTTLEVDGSRTITAKTSVIATGLRPSRPPVDGIELALDSDEFFQDRQWKDSVAMVGGGYIGIEFASMLASFGVDVTVFHRPAHLVKNHDRAIVDHLQECLEARGLTIHTGTEVQALKETDGGVRVEVDPADASTIVDEVIVAAGRRPNTEDLGLESTDVTLGPKGHVEVNDQFRTHDPAVYAAGDVLGHTQFTPVAIQEGQAAGANALGASESVNYEALPMAVFTDPPIGRVGPTEREAREQYEDIEVHEKTVKAFESAVLGHDEETYIRAYYHPEEDRLLAVHVVGPHAPEMVQGFGPAIRLGVSRDDLQNYPGIHPTAAEEIFVT